MNARKQKKVLVAPLEWGLGHATRCVPVIRELLRQGAEVILAADGRPYAFLEKEFPQLQLLRLPGYELRFPRHAGLELHLLLQSPLFGRKLREEKKQVEKLVEEHAIDIIISDNRFACRSEKTYNVYLTHQLRVKSAFSEKLATYYHKKHYEKFDEIWVPDVVEKWNLSGELGHEVEMQKPCKYIGPLTRFSKSDLLNSRPKKWWLLVLLSGPEPQRGLFEKMVLEELAKFTEDVLLLRGLPENETPLPAPYPHVTVVNHLPDAVLREELLSTHYVLCRPGYSTLCDLSALNVSPVVVPTPGQSEQEYLAAYHAAAGNVVKVPQKKFNLGEAIRAFHQVNLPGVYPDLKALEKQVRELLLK